MSLDFALKDIIRNRRVSKPFIIAIAATVTIIVFVLNLTSLLDVLFFGSESVLFSTGYNLVFQQYNSMLAILLAVLPISALISSLNAWIGHKKRDIATMKAIGAMPARLYNYFEIELLVITIIGYGIGLLCGSGIYLVVFFVIEGVGIFVSFQVEILWNLVVFVALIACVFFVGGAHVRKIAGTLTVAETLAGDIPRSTFAGNRSSGVMQWLTRRGTSVKVAIRNIIRRRYDFHRTFAILAISGTIMFISILGSISLSTTIQGYVNGTINEYTIAVGHSAILPYVSRLYGQFSDPSQAVGVNDVNFSLSTYFFDESKYYAFNTTAFNTISGVVRVDPRVCLLSIFAERQGYSYEGGVSQNVGHTREGVAAIMGVNSSLMDLSYFAEGTFVDPGELTNITIGDTIAYNYVDEYAKQTLLIHGETFYMEGVVIDTLYNGRSIYMGIQGLWNLWPEHAGKFNLLLIQVDPAQYETAISTLNATAKTQFGSAFEAIGLREIFSQNQAALNVVQGYFLIMAVITVIIASLALIEYQKGASSLKNKDFRIMRALGARRGFLEKTIYWENFLLTIPSFGLAMGIGMIFVEFFLMTNLKLLPPLWIPLSIGGALIAIFAIANLVIAAILFRLSRGLPDDLEH
jgi:ABC-type antimicrobial peptide transport system permease subunit